MDRKFDVTLVSTNTKIPAALTFAGTQMAILPVRLGVPYHLKQTVLAVS
jgi:hypothetical protein